MSKVLLFLSCLIAQVPDGTTRVVPGQGKLESYYGSRGEYLGQSRPNTQGGRTYTNQAQPSTRSVQTYNGGQRFYTTTQQNRYTNRPHGYGAFNAPSSKGKK